MGACQALTSPLVSLKISSSIRYLGNTPIIPNPTIPQIGQDSNRDPLKIKLDPIDGIARKMKQKRG